MILAPLNLGHRGHPEKWGGPPSGPGPPQGSMRATRGEAQERIGGRLVLTLRQGQSHAIMLSWHALMLSWHSAAGSAGGPSLNEVCPYYGPSKIGSHVDAPPLASGSSTLDRGSAKEVSVLVIIIVLVSVIVIVIVLGIVTVIVP